MSTSVLSDWLGPVDLARMLDARHRIEGGQFDRWRTDLIRPLLDDPGQQHWRYQVEGHQAPRWRAIYVRCFCSHFREPEHKFTIKQRDQEKEWHDHMNVVARCAMIRSEQQPGWDEPPERHLTAAPQPTADPAEPTPDEFYGLTPVGRFPAYLIRSGNTMARDASELECPGIESLILDDGTTVYQCQHCRKLLGYSDSLVLHYQKCRAQVPAMKDERVAILTRITMTRKRNA